MDSTTKLKQSRQIEKILKDAGVEKDTEEVQSYTNLMNWMLGRIENFKRHGRNKDVQEAKKHMVDYIDNFISLPKIQLK